MVLPGMQGEKMRTEGKNFTGASTVYIHLRVMAIYLKKKRENNPQFISNGNDVSIGQKECNIELSN